MLSQKVLFLVPVSLAGVTLAAACSSTPSGTPAPTPNPTMTTMMDMDSDVPSGQDGGATSSSSSSSSGASSGDAGGDSGPIIPTTTDDQYFGRVDLSDPQKPVFSWAGSAVRARFKGTEVFASFRETANAAADGRGLTTFSEYYVYIDGSAQPTLVKLASGAAPDVKLASNLANGEHDVMLVRKSDPFYGYTQFLGFNFGPMGTRVIPKPLPVHRVEVIGDAISAGYGAAKWGPFDGKETVDPAFYDKGSECWADGEVTLPAEQLRQQAQDAVVSYTQVLGNNLNAEVRNISWSGTGLLKAAGDTEPTAPQLYELTNPHKPAKWDFTKWAPEVVVVALGTKEIAPAQGAAVPGFADAYEALVKRVRANHPSAQIYCLESPMLAAFTALPNELTPKERGEQLINGVVKKLTMAGDRRVRYIPITNDARKLGCSFHPYKDFHARMATAVGNEIKVDLGWR
jgi:Carbohydrate esterase 2 N-terminal/GDSL-like Lipase/Acylhydrolase family